MDYGQFICQEYGVYTFSPLFSWKPKVTGLVSTCPGGSAAHSRVHCDTVGLLSHASSGTSGNLKFILSPSITSQLQVHH